MHSPKLRRFVPGCEYAHTVDMLIETCVILAELSMELKRSSEACDILSQARVALRKGHKLLVDSNELAHWEGARPTLTRLVAE